MKEWRVFFLDGQVVSIKAAGLSIFDGRFTLYIDAGNVGDGDVVASFCIDNISGISRADVIGAGDEA